MDGTARVIEYNLFRAFFFDFHPVKQVGLGFFAERPGQAAGGAAQLQQGALGWQLRREGFQQEGDEPGPPIRG
jgi:hypothetical protein